MSEVRITLLTALLAGLGPLSLALFTPAMPLLAEAFDTGDAAAKLTLSLYFAGFAIAQLISGPLSDRFGRKAIVQAFVLAYVAGCVGTLLASTIEAMIAARLLQGVGAAAGMVISRAIVRDLFTGEKSARILNHVNMIMGVAPAIAPAIGGVAIMAAGWQAPFVLMLSLGMATAGIIHFSLRETLPSDTPPLGISDILLNYAAILRHPYFLWSGLTVACTVATFYAQSTVLSFIVIDELGYTAGEFGLLMVLLANGYLFGALVASRLIGRIGAVRLTAAGLVILVVSALAMAILLIGYPPTIVGVGVPIMGMMFAGAFVAPGMYTAMLAPFPDKAGAASAMSGFMTMGLGLAASLTISGIPDLAAALALISAAMAIAAAGSYLVWRFQKLSSGPV